MPHKTPGRLVWLAVLSYLTPAVMSGNECDVTTAVVTGVCASGGVVAGTVGGVLCPVTLGMGCVVSVVAGVAAAACVATAETLDCENPDTSADAMVEYLKEIQGALADMTSQIDIGFYESTYNDVMNTIRMSLDRFDRDIIEKSSIPGYKGYIIANDLVKDWMTAILGNGDYNVRGALDMIEDMIEGRTSLMETPSVYELANEHGFCGPELYNFVTNLVTGGSTLVFVALQMKGYGYGVHDYDKKQLEDRLVLNANMFSQHCPDKQGWDASFVSNGGWWYVMNEKIQLGGSGDIPVPGKYFNKGEVRLAVFRPSNGNWYIKSAGAGDWGDAPGDVVVQCGGRGDTPVPGDYDGDGVAEIAVWRPRDGNWYIKGPGTADFTDSAGNKVVQCGGGSDVPVPHDYYGEGKLRIAVFRPYSGTWFIKGAGFDHYSYSSGNVELLCGGRGDVPVPGTYFGEEEVRIGVWRPAQGNWYLKSRGFSAGQNWGARPGDDVVIQSGLNGDIPTPYDFFGEGTVRIAVYRPSNGNWYIKGPGKKSWGESEGNVYFKGPGPYNGLVPVDIHKYMK